MVCATSGIVHAPEQERTLGSSPGVPPCREVLSSKSPVSEAPLLSPHSRSQGSLTYRAGLAARSGPEGSNTFIGYIPTFSLGEISGGRRERNRKARREKDKERRATSAHRQGAPPKTELQL